MNTLESLNARFLESQPPDTPAYRAARTINIASLHATLTVDEIAAIIEQECAKDFVSRACVLTAAYDELLSAATTAEPCLEFYPYAQERLRAAIERARAAKDGAEEVRNG